MGVYHIVLKTYFFKRKDVKLIERVPIILVPTELQRKILRHICMTANAGYESLTRDIGRDRTTILESIESLIKHHYVEKQKISPANPKSKLIFVPTLRGVAIAWSFFGFDIKKVVNMKKGEDEITRYLIFVKDIFSYANQRPMLEHLFRAVGRDYLEIEQGGRNAKQMLIKESFTRGLLELIRQSGYEVSKLFNERGIRWLNELYSQEELSEFKELLVRMEKNLTVIVEKFPA